MKEYTLLDIAEELSLDKGKVRRTITKLKLIALNEYTREHINSPKLYSKEALELVAKENNIKPKENAEARLEETTEPELVELLKAQLEEIKADKQRLEAKLEIAEERHAKQLEETNQLVKEAQQLVNQQQRLSLQANQKLEVLELELKEVKNIKEVRDPAEEVEETPKRKGIFSKLFNN